MGGFHAASETANKKIIGWVYRVSPYVGAVPYTPHIFWLVSFRHSLHLVCVWDSCCCCCGFRRCLFLFCMLFFFSFYSSFSYYFVFGVTWMEFLPLPVYVYIAYQCEYPKWLTAIHSFNIHVSTTSSYNCCVLFFSLFVRRCFSFFSFQISE